MKKSLFALAITLMPGLAWAQGAVLQNGPVTKFDVGGWIGDKALESSSKMFTDNFRGFNPMHVLDSGGNGYCIENALTNGPYNQLCLSHDASGNGIISIDSRNGLSDKSLFVRKNGVLYEVPFVGAGGGNVVGPSPTVVDTLPCWNNTIGTLLKNCGTITSRNYWSNTVTGNVGTNLVGGLEIATDSSTAISQTDIGKINGLYVNNTFGGGSPAGEGQRASIFGKLTQTGTTNYTSIAYQFNTGIWSWVLVNQGNTTVGQEINYMGYAGLVEVGGTNTRVNNIVGEEVDVNIGPTTVAGNRIGYLAAIGAGTFGAPTRAVGFDGAYAISRGTAGEASWKYGYMLRGPNGVWPFANDSVLIGGLGTSNGVGGVAGVAGTGIDLTGITFQYQQYISDTYQIDATGHTYQFNGFPEMRMKDTGVSVTTGGLTRWFSFGNGSWGMQINTAGGGNFSAAINAYTMTGTGGIGFGAEVKLASKTVATLPTCDGTTRDSLYLVSDALGPTWNATVAGGGAVRIVTLCDGSNWKVM